MWAYMYMYATILDNAEKNKPFVCITLNIY